MVSRLIICGRELSQRLMSGHAIKSLPELLRERGLEKLRQPFDFNALSALAFGLVRKVV